MTADDMLDELAEALEDGVEGITEWEEGFIQEMIDWIVDHGTLPQVKRTRLSRFGMRDCKRGFPGHPVRSPGGQALSPELEGVRVPLALKEA